MAREQSNFPGLKDPRKQSVLGRMADRDVDLAHARDWSRERMARQRKLNDAEATASWKGAEAREWDGKPGKSRGDTFREDLEKAILKPQLLAASLPLAASVPTSVAGKVIGGGLGAALGGVAGEDPYISALSVLHPALAAAQLGHMMYRDDEFAPMREAEAGVYRIPGGVLDIIRRNWGDKSAKAVREALRKTYRTGNEHGVISTSDSLQLITSNNPEMVKFSRGQLQPLYEPSMSADDNFILHTHPRGSTVAPSLQDINLRAGTQGTREMIASPDSGSPLLMYSHKSPRGVGADYEKYVAAVREHLEDPSVLRHLEKVGVGEADYGLPPPFEQMAGPMSYLRNLSKGDKTDMWYNDLGTYQAVGGERKNIADALEAYWRFLDADGMAKGGLARIAARMGSDAAPARRGVSNVIKEKGGNWLTGSVEDAVGGLKKGRIAQQIKPEDITQLPSGEFSYMGKSAPQILSPEEYAAIQRQWGVNSFIDKQLTNYIKKEMATPEDPIRALAERGVLHFDPRGSGYFVAGNRKAAGFPEEGLAVSPLAKAWEHKTDAAINPLRAGDFFSSKTGESRYPDTTHLNQWLAKVAKDTPVYEMLSATDSAIGFPHLIDELSNALNPESGLPRHLLLDPKSMPRVSVPQAVERVAEINKWRAAQKAEADAMRANNAATVLHKEYPENNPLGLRWVELRQPEGLPEGFKVEPVAQGFDLIDDKGNRLYAGREMTDAVRIAHGTQRARGINPLGDALKYEGDTMGHCVGGYCDDVASGRSQIFSLRDAKGQPHVTIETRPNGSVIGYDDNNEQVISDGASIAQIKGKGNRAPNPEYLPFVQDFVRSGKWSDVGDLQNSGLLKHSSGYLTKDELGKLVDEGDLDAIRLWQHSYIDR